MAAILGALLLVSHSVHAQGGESCQVRNLTAAENTTVQGWYKTIDAALPKVDGKRWRELEHGLHTMQWDKTQVVPGSEDVPLASSEGCPKVLKQGWPLCISKESYEGCDPWTNVRRKYENPAMTPMPAPFEAKTMADMMSPAHAKYQKDFMAAIQARQKADKKTLNFRMFVELFPYRRIEDCSTDVAEPFICIYRSKNRVAAGEEVDYEIKLVFGKRGEGPQSWGTVGDPRRVLAGTDCGFDTATHTTCPWKGVASYYDVVVDGEVNKDAAWYYPEPKPAAANIKGHVAFWRGVTVES